MSDETARKAIEKVFDSAKKHDIKKVIFKFSGGESLLEFPRILLLVEKAKTLSNRLQIQVEFVILTNGILITEKIAKEIKHKEIRVAVSLDGLEKYNDQTRIFPSGKGSFRLIENGIDNLLKTGVTFNVSVTVTSKNINGIPELTKYLLVRNIPFAFNFYRENPFVKEKLEGDDKKLVDTLKKAYSLIEKNPPVYSMMNRLLDRVSFRKPHLVPCGMGNSYLVIRHDGSLASCQMTLEKPIGTINDKDIIETMIKGNFVRPQGLNVDGKKPCHNCQWKYICCGGCPLLTFDQKGKYNTSTPYCRVYKELIPEIIRIEAKRLIKYGISNNNLRN